MALISNTIKAVRDVSNPPVHAPDELCERQCHTNSDTTSYIAYLQERLKGAEAAIVTAQERYMLSMQAAAMQDARATVAGDRVTALKAHIAALETRVAVAEEHATEAMDRAAAAEGHASAAVAAVEEIRRELAVRGEVVSALAAAVDSAGGDSSAIVRATKLRLGAAAAPCEGAAGEIAQEPTCTVPCMEEGWQEGTLTEGAWEEEAWEERAAEEGAWEEEAWKVGAWMERTLEEGVWEEETLEKAGRVSDESGSLSDSEPSTNADIEELVWASVGGWLHLGLIVAVMAADAELTEDDECLSVGPGEHCGDGGDEGSVSLSGWMVGEHIDISDWAVEVSHEEAEVALQWQGGEAGADGVVGGGAGSGDWLFGERVVVDDWAAEVEREEAEMALKGLGGEAGADAGLGGWSVGVRLVVDDWAAEVEREEAEMALQCGTG